jgi:hypothetical protein
VKKAWKELAGVLVVLVMCVSPCAVRANPSDNAKQVLAKLLLGKQVKALIELPATKEGLDVYITPVQHKRFDERGIDMETLTKYLKSKGVGVDANEWATTTDVKVDRDRVEIHLGGGGEGRRGSNHANKVSPSYKRAGGSRINFRFQRDITDSDLDPKNFLRVMGRVLDVSEIQDQLVAKNFPPEFQQAIAANTVKEGMTYQMVMLAFGDPEQKKINDTTDGSLAETWYYLKDGHRWVLMFTNGKVTKVQAF